MVELPRQRLRVATPAASAETVWARTPAIAVKLASMEATKLPNFAHKFTTTKEAIAAKAISASFKTTDIPMTLSGLQFMEGVSASKRMQP